MDQMTPTTGSRSKQTGVVASASATLLQVHLWSGAIPAGATFEGSQAVEVPASALAMVSDLLSLSRCEVKDASAASVSASFADTAEALNAARHLQRLVHGFSRASAPVRFFGCMTLMRADEPSTDAMLRQLHRAQALQFGGSGQVLLIGGICDTARTIPGLRFQTIPGGLPVPDKNTPPKAILQLLPPTHMDGYVEEPVNTDNRWAEPRASTSTFSAARSAEDSGGHAKREPRPNVVVPVDMPINALVRDTADEDEAEPAQKFNPLWAVIIGSIGVLAVAAVILFFTVLKKPSQPVAPANQPAAGGADTTTPGTPSTVPAPGPATTTGGSTPVPETPKAAPAPKESVAAKIKDKLQGKPSTPKAPPAETTDTTQIPKSNGRVSFSPAEISSLIARADKDSGDGNFDKAILEYQTVLRQDPNNAEAKRGLAKAKLNKENQ